MIKRCRCGRGYDANAWSRLELVGDMKDEVEHLEMRNCECGSTIAAVVASVDDDGTRFYLVQEMEAAG